MHDYNPLAVCAFTALAIVFAVVLMFVLAWMEPVPPAEVQRRAVDARLVGTRESRVRPVVLALERRRQPIMKMGRGGVATG